MRILKLSPQTEASLLKNRKGQDLTAHRTAARIVADVQHRGDAALDAWSRKLDGIDTSGKRLWVTQQEIAAAKKRVSRDFLRAVKHAAANVRRVAEKQLPRAWSLQVEPGVNIAQLIRPIESIGCYIPGGRFALFSTMVMTVVPAHVAGVKRIVVVCPRANDELLATGGFAGRNAPGAHRWCPSHRRFGLRNQAHRTRGKDLWARQSLCHCRQANHQFRLRD